MKFDVREFCANLTAYSDCVWYETEVIDIMKTDVCDCAIPDKYLSECRSFKGKWKMHCISTVHYLASYNFWDNLQHKADKFSVLLHHAYLSELSTFRNQQSAKHAWRLSSLIPNIYSVQSFLPLEFICLDFFNFSYHVSGLLHIGVCVCVEVLQRTPTFSGLVFFLTQHSSSYFHSEVVHMCISVSLCLSVCPHITSWDLQSGFFFLILH